jgi:hypothetical protein
MFLSCEKHIIVKCELMETRQARRSYFQGGVTPGFINAENIPKKVL